MFYHLEYHLASLPLNLKSKTSQHMLHCHRNKLNLKNFSRGQLIAASFFSGASILIQKMKYLPTISLMKINS